MSRILTPDDLTKKVWDVLYEIGLPKHVAWANINLQVGEPIEITCKFYPIVDDQFIINDDAVVMETKRFQLIEITSAIGLNE